MSARTTRSTADQPRSRGGHSLSSPFFSALLCPFPALSLPETSEFPSISAKSSIVGYQTVARPQQYFSSGSMFKNINSEGVSLADLKISGTMSPSAKAQWRNCNINFFKSGATALLDSDRKYWMDWNGNWRKFIKGNSNPDNDPFMTQEEIAAVVINPGEAVVCNFGNTSAKITYVGEVLKGNSSKLLSITRPQQYFVVTNPSGSTINLSQITITGTMSTSAKAQWRNCNINFFRSGATAIFDSDKKYWMDWNGNWRRFIKGNTNPDNDPFMTQEEIEAVVINPGEGFVCNFANASATITLPSAL